MRFIQSFSKLNRDILSLIIPHIYGDMWYNIHRDMRIRYCYNIVKKYNTKGFSNVGQQSRLFIVWYKYIRVHKEIMYRWKKRRQIYVIFE